MEHDERHGDLISLSVWILELGKFARSGPTKGGLCDSADQAGARCSLFYGDPPQYSTYKMYRHQDLSCRRERRKIKRHSLGFSKAWHQMLKWHAQINTLKIPVGEDADWKSYRDYLLLFVCPGHAMPSFSFQLNLEINLLASIRAQIGL